MGSEALEAGVAWGDMEKICWGDISTLLYPVSLLIVVDLLKVEHGVDLLGRHGETLTALLSSKCPQHHQGKSQQHNKRAKANNTTLRQEPTT